MAESHTDAGEPGRAAPPASEEPGLSGAEAALRALQHVVQRERRLEALRRTALLDSPAEEAFDRLAWLATKAIDVPVALVTLVDKDRQFFKSCVGLPPPWCDVRQTPLTHSFCMHVVATGEPLVIEDARLHPVLRENLAVDQLRVVAYAGMPLTASQGETLGTFCVIDHVPRAWTDDDLEVLADLAASVMVEIELRAMRQLELHAREREAAHAELEAARRRLGLLAELSIVLAELRQEHGALDRAARLCVPVVADGCAFDVLEDDGRLRRVSVSHVDAREEERLRTEARPPLLLASEPEQASEVTGHLRLTGSEGSSLRVPLTGRGRVLGAASFTTVPPRRLGELEVELARDVARRVALALDNARLHEESLEAIRLRDRFLAIASHELRTPLTALRLQTQSLLRGAGDARRAPSAGQVAEKVRMIARQVARLGDLVDELLDISRISEGRLAFRLEAVDLLALVREVADGFSEELARAGSALVLRGAAGAVVGRWDRLRLEQVVTNLLANAVKYGQGRPVTVALEADAHSAWLTVSDEGIGIAARDQARIFERFERAVSEQHYGGFGLGLWIVREIVRQLGGTISVHSAPGAGASFTVELPREPTAEGPRLLH